jgi:3-hydroxyisobutyrate dehydrogenase/2-hydroxy-3-oxopropionate reductase
MTRVDVAFLGLGRMGVPMAARLAATGFGLRVWNRTPRPDAVPEGAVVADTPRATVASADFIVTMLADMDALLAVLGGPNGILAGANSGGVLIDMSTIGPHAARLVDSQAQSAGLTFVDAPVSGSVGLAASGALVAIVGGDPAVVERVRPVLAAMTREQIHLGEVGTGAAMKIALNAALAVTNQTIAETLALAERAAIARERAYDVLSIGALSSPYLGYKRQAFLDPEGSPVAFSVALMAEDVTLALELANETKLDLPVLSVVSEQLRRAREVGLGERDLSAVVETYAG